MRQTKTARETLQELELRVASLEREAGLFNRVKRMFSSWETLARSGEKDLKGADLKGARLDGAVFKHTNLRGVKNLPNHLEHLFY